MKVKIEAVQRHESGLLVDYTLADATGPVGETMKVHINVPEGKSAEDVKELLFQKARKQATIATVKKAWEKFPGQTWDIPPPPEPEPEPEPLP